MRIGIDGRKIGDTGIGRVIENLIENLLLAESEHSYFLFLAPEDMDRYDYPKQRVTKIAESSRKYGLMEHLRIPAKSKRLGIDLFHCPHYTLPLMLKCRSVVTIHDLIHLETDSISVMKKRYARFMIGSAIKKASAVITVSEATKKSLLSKFDIEEKKINVVYNGAGDFRKLQPEQAMLLLEKIGIKTPYFLFVGSDRPHKNLKAVAGVLEKLPHDSRFVVAGRVADRSRFEKFGDRIIFANSLLKKEMEALYSMATALLFPSYIEGFGLPVTEAQACGTAVVTSNCSSMPEAGGVGAVYADPDDHAGMAQALMKIDSDDGFRDRLVAEGTKNIKRFSWRKCAEETLAVYEKVMSR